jgi:hypothetical protein
MEITAAEVECATRKLSNGKAPGPDGVPNELLKVRSAKLRAVLALLLSAVAKQGKIPEAWNTATVIPVYKKSGAKTSVASYRPITLLAAGYKLFETVILRRIDEAFEKCNALNDMQFGFRSGRGTTDAALLLHETIQAVKDSAKGNGPADSDSAVTAFLDVRAAYDGVWREAVLAQCAARGLPPGIRIIIEEILRKERIKRRVLVCGEKSAEFSDTKGVPQGAVTSPTLYNTFIDDLIRTLEKDAKELGVKVMGRTVHNLHYADDIAIVTKDVKGMRKALETCDKHAAKWQYAYNGAKCRAVCVGKNKLALQKEIREHNLQIGTGEGRSAITMAESFKYLGLETDFNAICGWTARWEKVLREQRMSALRSGKELLTLARRFANIPPATVFRLFKALVKPKMLFGCQIWGPQITSRQRTELDSVQNWFTRRLLDCNIATPQAFVEGEFAEIPPSMHCDELALRFAGRLLKADSTSPKVLREIVIAQFARMNAPTGQIPRILPLRANSWAARTYGLFERYGLGLMAKDPNRIPTDAMTADGHKSWNMMCKDAVRRAWEAEWSKNCARHPSLSAYSTIRTGIRRGTATYLRIALPRATRRTYAEARAGVLPTAAFNAYLLAKRRAKARATIESKPSRANNAVLWTDATLSDEEITAAALCARCGLCNETVQHAVVNCTAVDRATTATEVVQKAQDKLADVATPLRPAEAMRIASVNAKAVRKAWKARELGVNGGGESKVELIRPTPKSAYSLGVSVWRNKMNAEANGYADGALNRKDDTSRGPGEDGAGGMVAGTADGVSVSPVRKNEVHVNITEYERSMNAQSAAQSVERPSLNDVVEGWKSSKKDDSFFRMFFPFSLGIGRGPGFAPAMVPLC